MQTQINRAVKRAKIMRTCEHNYTDNPLRDPLDKRRMLTPGIVTLTGKDAQFMKAYCYKCGTGKLLST